MRNMQGLSNTVRFDQRLLFLNWLEQSWGLIFAMQGKEMLECKLRWTEQKGGCGKHQDKLPFFLSRKSTWAGKNTPFLVYLANRMILEEEDVSMILEFGEKVCKRLIVIHLIDIFLEVVEFCDCLSQLWIAYIRSKMGSATLLILWDESTALKSHLPLLSFWSVW